MAPPPLLLLQDIGLTFGSTPLLAGASLSIGPSERLCLVGRNGSGKSTLLKIADGQIDSDSGSRFVQPGESRPSPAGRIPRRCQAARQGAALARVLAPEPDILLLDEPTNHLDVVAIVGLEAALKSLRSAVVMISHDRRFLENLSQQTVWPDRGITRRLDKGFAAFEAWRDALLEAEELERHKLGRRIVQEEHWLRYGVSARRKRNQRRLETLVALRQARKRALVGRTTGQVKLSVQEAKEIGKLVIEAKRIAKSYGELTVVRDFSVKIARGDRIGIVGPNGAGKTTLINMLTGALAPDTGYVRLGPNLEIATLDQRR